MGGHCAGSLLLPRFVPPDRHPLRVYARLELGIGSRRAGPVWRARARQLYVASVGHGFLGILLRGAGRAICLLPPTLLMGATLPAVARWVESTPQGVSWLGFFYGGNIAGAVVGCLLAGFYLLRVHDMATATYVAAAHQRSRWRASPSAARPTATPYASAGCDAAAPQPRIRRAGRTAGPSMWSIGLSGAAALGAEVIWTRLLSLLLGGTVYTFSIILAVFLSGLGIGSSGGAWLARDEQRPGAALAVCQMLRRGRRSPGRRSSEPRVSLLADRPGARAGPVVQLPDRSAARAARRLAGRVLGARAFRSRSRRWPRPSDQGRARRRACTPPTRSARSSAPSLQPADHSGPRHAGRAAAADLDRVVRGGGRHARVAAAHRAASCQPARRASRAGGGGRSSSRRWRRLSVAPVPPDLVAYGRQIATFKGATLPVRRRRAELLDRRLGAGGRRPQLPRQRQSRSLDRSRTTCGCSGCSATCPRSMHPSPRLGARRRLRRRRHRRLLRAPSRRQADRHLRDRAADSADGRAVLQQGELRRRERPARRDRL